ncbi:hypothetical protein WDU94_012857 [Cyamophila willieti]
MKHLRAVVSLGVICFGVQLASAKPIIQTVAEYIEEQLEPLKELFKDGTIKRMIKHIIFKEAGETLHGNTIKEDKTLPGRVLNIIMNDQNVWMDQKEVIEFKKEIKYGFNSGALALLDSQVDDVFSQMMNKMKERTKEEITKAIDEISQELKNHGIFGLMSSSHESTVGHQPQ